MKRQLIDVSLPHQYFSASLSPSLPLSLKINKILKEIYHANHNLKMAGVITLISDKIDFKTKIVSRAKKGYIIKIKGPICQEDITTTINIYAPNNRLQNT